MLIHARRIRAALFVAGTVKARTVVAARLFGAGGARGGLGGFDQTGIVITDMVNQVMRGHDGLLIGSHIAVIGAIIGAVVAPVAALLVAALLVAALLVAALLVAALLVATLLVATLLVATLLVATLLVVARLVAALIAVPLRPVALRVLAILLAAALGVGLLILLPAFLFGGHFAVRLGQKPGVVFGVLQEVLGSDAVI